MWLPSLVVFCHGLKYKMDVRQGEYATRELRDEGGTVGLIDSLISLKVLSTLRLFSVYEINFNIGIP